MPKITRPPKLSRHKASGQAYVTWQKKRHYLGAYGSKQAGANYARFLAGLADWTEPQQEAEPEPPTTGWISVVELCAAYLAHAEGWYLKDGKPTTELEHVKRHIKILVDHYEALPVNEFGPKRLKMIQASLVDGGYTRVWINALVSGIKRIFRWGVSEELVPSGIAHALDTVRGLVKGRTTAPERPPVRPVDDPTIEATLPFTPAVVADMVQFQRLTGSRPGEVCIVRPCDVDREGDVWVYRPESHKTQHHGKNRLIFIGPKAQQILRPYLLRPADAYCFQPSESEKARLQEVHAARKTPLSCGNRPGKNLVKHPQHKPGDRYTKDSYNRAIRRAVEKANKERRKNAEDGEKPKLVEHWSPNRLRHAAATEIRKTYGLEAAQTVLGHSKASTTEIYAERDAQLAREVAKRIG